MQLEKLNVPQLTTISQESINVAAEQIALMVEDGYTSALETDIRLKALSEIIDRARKKIEKSVVNEIEMGKIKSVAGCDITIRQGAAILDYESDMEYKELKCRLDERKDALNSAYKAHKKGNTLLSNETAEMMPIVPVKTYQKDSIIYKIKD